MNFDEMPAGPEMDRLICEKVLARPWRKPTHGTCCTCQTCGLSNDGGLDGCHCGISEDIGMAWEIVEHFRNKQWTVKLQGHEWYDGGAWECILLDALDGEQGRGLDKQTGKGKQGGWEEPSAPLAICRAALEAVYKEE